MMSLVLAAGKGTRLRPLTADKPKALVRVDGKPLLAHCYDTLADLGATEFVTVYGYKGEQIKDHFGDTYRGRPITYVEQNGPTGTAGAVRSAAPYIEDEVMLQLPDVLFDSDLSRAIDAHQQDDADATIVTEAVPYDEASRYGVVETDANGNITELVEKPDDPPSNKILTGFYTFPPAIFEACDAITPSDRGELEITDAIQKLVEWGYSVKTVPLKGWRKDVGYPDDRDQAEQYLRQHAPAPASTSVGLNSI